MNNAESSTDSFTQGLLGPANNPVIDQQPKLNPMEILDSESDVPTGASSRSTQFTNNSIPSYSKCVRLELHKRMQNQDFLPTPGHGGLNSMVLETFKDSESDEDDDDPKRGKGVEIEPPSQMSYYNNIVNHGSISRNKFDIKESFAEGLKANKNNIP